MYIVNPRLQILPFSVKICTLKFFLLPYLDSIGISIFGAAKPRYIKSCSDFITCNAQTFLA